MEKKRAAEEHGGPSPLALPPAPPSSDAASARHCCAGGKVRCRRPRASARLCARQGATSADKGREQAAADLAGGGGEGACCVDKGVGAGSSRPGRRGGREW